MNQFLSLKDPRYFQIGFLSIFLLSGLFFLDWNISSVVILTILTTTILVQYGAIKILNLNKKSILSGIVSSLGLILLLKANQIETYLLASVLTIGSKFIIRYKGKHIFNPVNFGIIVTLLLTNDAWISPGQWGSNGIYLFIIGIFSWLVLTKVKQLLNGLVFLGTLALLNVVYLNLYLEWPLDFVTHKFTNGALLLFSFFMITDPRTTPNSLTARIIWSASIAVISFILMEFYYVHSAPFWVLFFTAPLTPVIDSFTKTKAFQWASNIKA